MTERTVKLNTLARVEGEGSLFVKVRKGKIESLAFKIYEPPRFFEAFLRGKGFNEVPDITARICGICPVAYQMSSVHSLENAFGVRITREIRELRRLLYCAEWIESHALHIFMLHAPDFLGCQDGLELAKKNKELVQMGLRLKKVGNALTALLGGREIHPISVRVGGFYKAPAVSQLRQIEADLAWASSAAEKTLAFAAGLDFPACEYDYEFVSLRHPKEYPFNEGRIVSNKGLNIASKDYNAHFEEIHVERSNALHSRLKKRGHYLVGPQARFSLCYDLLPSPIRKLCAKYGLQPPANNPFKSIMVRAVETLFACEEALRIVRSYRELKRPFVEVEPRAAEGHAATEAPRGLLYHRYKTSGDGKILEAQIVPPTAQNQGQIEDDLRAFIPGFLDLPDEQFSIRCEQTVRNYDPCISCATHFLDVRREGR